MKKIVALMLALLMTSALVSCSKGKTSTASNDSFAGRWSVDHIEYEGSDFTVAEWKATQYDDFGDRYIVIKSGGKAYVYDGYYGELVNWARTETGAMIDGENYKFADGFLILKYDDAELYFKKVSSLETIPDESSSSDFADSDSTDDADSDDSDSADDDSGWREFIADYESWVDKYIDLVGRYKSNPSDLSLLGEYTEMLQEISDWSERADEVSDSLSEHPEQLSEYMAALGRISQKLASAGL